MPEVIIKSNANGQDAQVGGGAENAHEWPVLSVDVVREVNKIPWARIALKDGDFGEKPDFAISSTDFFKLGATIEIRAKESVNEDSVTLFKGLVVRHAVKADVEKSVLVIELKDPAFKMTRVRRSVVHGDANDGKDDKTIIENDIINKHYSNEYSLDLTKMPNRVKHKELVQYYCTDWDFILSRAEANGCWVMVNGEKIQIGKVTSESLENAQKTFKYIDENCTIYSFHMELDGRHHYNHEGQNVMHDNIEGAYFSFKDQEIKNEKSNDDFTPLKYKAAGSTEAEAGGANVTDVETLDRDQGSAGFNDVSVDDVIVDEAVDEDAGKTEEDLLKSAHKLGGGKYTLFHPVDISGEEAQVWANAHQRKSRLSLFKGRIRIDGNQCKKSDQEELLCLGDAIELENMASRFNGATFITGIRHQITVDDGWKSDIQFGMSPEWFTEQNGNMAAPPAGGLLPAVHGLHIGKVKKIDPRGDSQQKEENHYKVKVEIPVPDSKDGKNIIWARHASPYAGNNRGMLFKPEEGDEVVLGFLNDDPRHAIIIGSLYSSKNKQLEMKEDNEKYIGEFIKSISMKENHSLVFNSEQSKRSIALRTPRGNCLTMSDESEGEFRIKDEHGNEILMNKEGITIKTEQNTIEMKNNAITANGLKIEA